MVIRVLSVPDSLDLPDFDGVFRTVLGWYGLGFVFRVHGQEFNSFRRAIRSKVLREFQLRPSETFLYTCGAIDLWEWEFRLLDQEPGTEGDEMPLCLGGRGAAPPEHCGGPTGYRMMLKRQRQGEAMCTRSTRSSRTRSRNSRSGAWAGAKKEASFRLSMCHQDASGDLARHERLKAQPPKRPMKLPEARSYVAGLLRTWAEEIK